MIYSVFPAQRTELVHELRPDGARLLRVGLDLREAERGSEEVAGRVPGKDPERVANGDLCSVVIELRLEEDGCLFQKAVIIFQASNGPTLEPPPLGVK